MSLLIGGLGSQNIAAPFPAPVVGIKLSANGTVPSWNSSAVNAELANLFPLPANDGSYVSLPNTKTGNVVIYSAALVALYTVAPTAINAAATAWCGFWLDTTDGAIWAIAGNATAGQGYLGKINFSTGVVTAVGTGFTGQSNTLGASGSNLPYAMTERAAMGSGDITQWTSSGWRFSVSTTTGAVTVAEALLAVNGGAPAQIYHTADQTVFASWSLDQTGAAAGFSLSQAIMWLWRNGTHKSINIDTSPIGGFGPLGSYCGAMPWGASNVIVGGAGLSTVSIYGVVGCRIFQRAAFDSWLKQLANNIGLP